jgi:recombination protein RecA
LDLYYNKGIDTFGEAIDLAVKYGMIEKKGGWFNYFSFPNDKPIQGKSSVVEYFKQNEKEYLSLKQQVLDHFNGSAKEGKPTFLPIEEKKEEKKSRGRKVEEIESK